MILIQPIQLTAPFEGRQRLAGMNRNLEKRGSVAVTEAFNLAAALQLLPAEKTRDRAEALTVRGNALLGMGKLEDAKAAWRGAIQRYDELGEGKPAASLHHRIARLEARAEGHDTNGAGPVDSTLPAEAEVTS